LFVRDDGNAGRVVVEAGGVKLGKPTVPEVAAGEVAGMDGNVKGVEVVREGVVVGMAGKTEGLATDVGVVEGTAGKVKGLEVVEG
jgi:hypothetical protein